MASDPDISQHDWETSLSPTTLRDGICGSEIKGVWVPFPSNIINQNVMFEIRRIKRISSFELRKYTENSSIQERNQFLFVKKFLTKEIEFLPPNSCLVNPPSLQPDSVNLRNLNARYKTLGLRHLIAKT